MNFVLISPLAHRALVKIVVTLWNQKDVRALISKFDFKQNSLTTNCKWRVIIEGKVTEKVSQLSLPPLLKEKVLDCIKPIGLEIHQWMKFHSSIHVNLPAELLWTPQGTVDGKRTADVLVTDQNLDISTRYKLACLYCLEDSIIALWNTMSEDLKQYLLCNYYSTIAKWDKKRIISFWSCIMNSRGLADAPTSYGHEFQQCAYRGNKVAAEYFLQKLTPQERKASLVETAKCVGDADVLCFLLSEMDEEQQMEVFKDDPRRVLEFFLEWPRQSLFIEIANCMWDFLSKEHFEAILTTIIHKIGDGYNNWNYRKLFREFWQKSPDALKSLVTNDDTFLLMLLLCIKDRESLRLILKDATLTAKDKLIYSNGMFCIYQDCIHNNEWDLLEFCIRECSPSKNETLKFKERFEKSVKMWDDIEDSFLKNKHKWDQLFRFSDDSICEYDKKSAEGGESSSSK